MPPRRLHSWAKLRWTIIRVATPSLYLSPTKLRTYATCPLQYSHRYLTRLEAPYTPASLIGEAVHQVLEINFREKRHSGDDLGRHEAEDLYDRVWVQRAPVGLSGSDEKDVWSDAYARGLHALQYYLVEEVPHLVPHLVEHRFRFEVPNVRWPIVGNFKTSRRHFDPTYLQGDLQLMCYAIGYAAFRAGSRVRPGHLPGPYFIPDVRVDVLIVGEPPAVQRLEARYGRDDLVGFGKRAASIALGIEGERFDAFWRLPDADVDPTVCHRCSYAPRCADSLVAEEDLLETNGEY